jgi:hypothetical protein
MTSQGQLQVTDPIAHEDSWVPVYNRLGVENLRRQFIRNGPEIISSARQDVLGISLCTYCAILFEHWGERYCEHCKSKDELCTPYYHTTMEIDEARRKGCRLCAYILSIVESNWKEHFWRTFGTIFSVKLFRKDTSLVEEGWELRVKFSHWGFVEIRLLPDEGNDSRKSGTSRIEHEFGDTKYNVETDGSHSFELARKWLRQCSKTHQACELAQGLRPPTRLIKIDSNHISLHISDFSEKIEYLTLSHR